MEQNLPYKLKPGDSAPNFNLPAVEGGNFTLENFDLPILVVFFTCNHCPYAKAYEDRVKDAQQDFGGEVDFCGINSNDAENYPEDSFEKMQERRKERFFNFMYLHDETQDVAKAYGAQVTPHFFVLDKDRKVQYQGNFDDNWENPEAVNISELKNAIKALIEGKEVSVKETPVVGCSIKWKHGNAPNE
ncbi:MAG: thioredoxin family protein [Candidatus Woesearchaeota archaeon]|jgi:peroxiredoxin|nr:thioredoxin family protein [Candidatus Woesearchaeota archaeon]MDP7457146.1 thioredoxin family protein [Candidatus Woesearchaeota archaeon]